MTRRTRWLVGSGAVLVATLGVLSVVAYSAVSPEQRLAASEPPPAPHVTVEIESRLLIDAVTFRGEVVAATTQPITLPPSRQSALPTPVVTGIPNQGDQLHAGAAIVWISDRPLIAMPMNIPLHRTILPFDEGEDVRRLQIALKTMGYNVGETSVFDRRTQTAITRMYDTVGSSAPRHVAEQSTGTDAGETDGAVAANQESQRPSGVLASPDELIAVTGLPATVASHGAAIGQVVAGETPLLTLTSPSAVVAVQTAAAAAQLMQPGLRATALDLDPPTVLVVDTVEGLEGDELLIRFRPEPTDALPATSIGQGSRVEVTVETTTEPVLAVPTTAIRTGSNGPYLLLDAGDAGPRRVAVETGRSIGGWVELVNPSSDLKRGRHVRVA